MTVSPRPEIAALPPYRPGAVPLAGPDGESHKLSSNENPFPVLPEIAAAIAAAGRESNRYPDAGNTALAEALAAQLGVEPGQLGFGTGSVAVLYHALQAVCRPGDEVIFAWRSFEAYPLAVAVAGATAVPVPLAADGTHDLQRMVAAITERTRVIMICTPNNPTGPAVQQDQFHEFLQQVPPHIMIIIDEAYQEFVTQKAAVSGLDWVASYPQVVVLRTFAKAYALAGLRVGYCVAHPELAEAIRKVALPFGVSRVAQAAARAALQVKAALDAQVAELISRRDALLAALRAQGLRVPDSQGNFVWLALGAETQAWANEFSAQGIAVRAFADGTEQAGIRISVGTAAAAERVLQVTAGLVGKTAREELKPGLG